MSRLLERDQFRWQLNPLVAGTRESIEAALIGYDPQITPGIARDATFQSMMSVCYYDPSQMWQDSDVSIQSAVSFVESQPSDNKEETAPELDFVNLEIIDRIVATHISRALSQPDNGFSALNNDPFNGQSAAISSKGKSSELLANSGQLVVSERFTGSAITLKPVDIELSQEYAKSLHYIHKAREDERFAFGAFFGTDELPYAWVSYGTVRTQSETDIVENAGLTVDSTVEMSRAWNAVWAPKNSMSVLFAFAHKQLQLLMGPGLKGVVTAINPNLGFTAAAFRGVDFDVIGTKPTEHSYLLDNNGIPIYGVSRAIAAELELTVDELTTDPRYGKSRMPLLPTNVLAVLFNGTSRQKPTTPLLIA